MKEQFILEKVREIFPTGEETLRECLAAYEHHFTIFGNLEILPQLEIARDHYGKICSAWGLRLPDKITEQTKDAQDLLYKLLGGKATSDDAL